MEQTTSPSYSFNLVHKYHCLYQIFSVELGLEVAMCFKGKSLIVDINTCLENIEAKNDMGFNAIGTYTILNKKPTNTPVVAPYLFNSKLNNTQI